MPWLASVLHSGHSIYHGGMLARYACGAQDRINDEPTFRAHPKDQRVTLGVAQGFARCLADITDSATVRGAKSSSTGSVGADHRMLASPE